MAEMTKDEKKFLEDINSLYEECSKSPGKPDVILEVIDDDIEKDQ